MKEFCNDCGAEITDDNMAGYMPADYVYWTFKPVCIECYFKRLSVGKIDHKNIVRSD
jgi:hypothetical protein